MERIVEAAREIFIEILVKGHQQCHKDDTHHEVAEKVGLLKEDSVLLEPDNIAGVAALMLRDLEVQAIVAVMMVKILQELDYANCALNDITTVEPFLPNDEEDAATRDDSRLLSP